MGKISTKLTALTTAVSLVVASFVAFTHSHGHQDHAAAGPTLTCCGHQFLTPSATDHPPQGACCNDANHAHDADPFLATSDVGLTQFTNGHRHAHADHLCALCTFLTEHSADFSPEFSSDLWNLVSSIPDAVAVAAAPSVFNAYLLRGPPRV